MLVVGVDLFRNMSEEVAAEMADIMEEQNYEAGTVLFKAGDPADNMYFVEDGEVHINMSDPDRTIHVARLKGEVVGWSSVAGREEYTAWAECAKPCRLICINKEKLDVVLQKHTAYGLVFYKNLAGVMGERLLLCHAQLATVVIR